ncbi:hypothetical protein VKT23_009992 [Stygiomarasmius scandens]|uniref:Uncharacterized protein n=1 Tax=Marasmiellus scandens TaxID=2682957 RepID=A0ABR1JFD9_9AGAR
MAQVPCIIPNPDISGVGVRTAIYIQAVLTLVQPIVAAWDGHIDPEELASLHAVYVSILLPGCALLSSAIIQANTFGLSVYHGLIVLNLSWINNTSALTFFTFVVLGEWDRKSKSDTDSKTQLENLNILQKKIGDKVAKMIEDGAQGEEHVAENRREQDEEVTLKERWATLSRNGSRMLRLQITALIMAEGHLNSGRDLTDEKELSQAITEIELLLKLQQDTSGFCDYLIQQRNNLNNTTIGPSLRRLFNLCKSPKIWTMAALASVHLIIVGAFGLWLWLTIHTFGNQTDCIPLTTVIVFGHSVPVLSNTLRIVSITLYILSSIPLLNIVICICAVAAVVLFILYIFSLRSRLAAGTTLSDRILSTAVAPSPSPSQPAQPGDRTKFLSAVLPILLCQLYFIICTELTINTNQPLLISNDGRESDWTFGQTLAVALTLLPLLEISKFLRKKFLGTGTAKAKD